MGWKMNKWKVEEIEWHEIYPFWSQFLWPGRPQIKPYTPMLNATDKDMNIHKLAGSNFAFYAGVFFGVKTVEGDIVGVNSGHQCSNTLFRSRGLYVRPEVTGRGIAQALLTHTIEFARENGFKKIWSYPREKAIPTYKAVGYDCGKAEIHEAYEKEDGTIVKRDNAYAELIL